jgi:hypothetical protein
MVLVPVHRGVHETGGIAHSPLTPSTLSFFLLAPLLRDPLPPLHPVCERRLDPPVAFRSSSLQNTDNYIYVFPLGPALSVIINNKNSTKKQFVVLRSSPLYEKRLEDL